MATKRKYSSQLKQINTAPRIVVVPVACEVCGHPAMQNPTMITIARVARQVWLCDWCEGRWRNVG